MREDKDTFIRGLTMKTLALFNENQDTACTKRGSENAKTGKEACNEVAYDETADGAAGGTGSPIDIPALQTHHLQRSLQTPEDGEILIVSLGIHQRTSLGLLDTEEQRQGLGSGNQEDAGTDEHHDALLDILLLVVHLDVHRDSTNDGDNTGNGVTELDGNGDILGNLGGYRAKSLRTSGVVTGSILGHDNTNTQQQHANARKTR